MTLSIAIANRRFDGFRVNSQTLHAVSLSHRGGLGLIPGLVEVRFGVCCEKRTVQAGWVARTAFLLTLLGALLIGTSVFSSCGDLYSEIAPEQKQVRSMVIDPDNGRQGQVLVDSRVTISVPGQQNYVSGFDFGEGIELIRYNASESELCPEAGRVVDNGEFGYWYTICVTLELRDDATTGERTISIDVESDTIPVIARESFFVLPLLEPMP